MSGSLLTTARIPAWSSAERLPAAELVRSGTVLRTLREKTGLTAREVAERAKISESYLSRVESGKTNPTDAWLGFIAGVLSDALVEKASAADEGTTSRQQACADRLMRTGPVLTTAKAADYVGLKPQTLRKHAMDGTGPQAYKHGRLTVYYPTDLDAWLAGRLELVDRTVR